LQVKPRRVPSCEYVVEGLATSLAAEGDFGSGGSARSGAAVVDHGDGKNPEGSTPRLTDLDAARRILVADEEEQVAAAGDHPAIADYLIEECVGSGGAGRVFRARQAQTNHEVAIKLLNQRLGESPSAARAWRELQVLGQLRLACLPRLLDYGEHEGRLYLVSEFIDGLTLADYCDGRRLDCRRRVELLADVAEALHELHGYGVIHRDIKPDNIIVDNQGRPFIVDLGLASLLGDDSTRTITEEGVPVGSPAFMSPEQARGDLKALSALSDVYSLGSTAYFILTGDTPHDTHTSVHEAIRRVAQEPPRSARAVCKSLPKPLAAVLSRCVSPHPRERYSSAQAFAADLRRWLRGDAVEASPPSAAQSLGRFVGRHPVLTTTALCAVILLLTVVLSYGSTWWLNQRPFEMRVSDTGRLAMLVSRSGQILHQWDTEQDGGVVVAKLVDNGERVVVLGTRGGSATARPGELCLYHLDQPEEPFWSSGTRFEVPEPISTIEGDYHQLSWASVEGVFSESPSPEIVAVHRHSPHSANLIRVYSLEVGEPGKILYEVWHDGHIFDALWHETQHLLFLCGLNSEGSWRDRGVDDPSLQHPPFVILALRPEAGKIHREWIKTPGGGGRFEALWYRGVLPAVHTQCFSTSRMALRLPNDPRLGDRAVQLSLSTSATPQASITFTIDRDGAEIGVERFVSGNYGRDTAMPNSADFAIQPLPPLQEPPPG
jgi:serine/threonine protein kinase